MTRLIPVSLTNPSTTDANDVPDGLVLIGLKAPAVNTENTWVKALGSTLVSAVANYVQLDASATSGVSFIPVEQAPGKRVVLSVVGSLNADVDDVRKFGEAASAAMRKCKSIGIKKPTVIILDNPSSIAPAGSSLESYLVKNYSKFLHVTLLGMMEETYQPLQVREWSGNPNPNPLPIIRVAVADPSLESALFETVEWVSAVEEGRIVARDIGSADPERMTPLNCAAYIEKSFQGVPNVKVTVIRDKDVLAKEYPLLHAVARCSLSVPAHAPAVVRLEYHSSDQDQVSENLFFVGKGVVYDTGGADIKYGGSMRGMSRDKCGAAACAGFIKTVSLLKPNRVNVIADLGFVRNSAGATNYVSDEVLMSRAGVRVLVGNTDAEGRMVMTDLLAQAKERALSPQYATIPSRLFTVATLTGHAIRAVGIGYNISLDNGPAREAGISKRLFDAGHVFGDPFETSTLRREDYDLICSKSISEDVIQANDKPSTQSNRGHQYPAAFMAIASGLTQHGIDSSNPLSYTHMDIAASAEGASQGLSLPFVTGCPIVALTGTFCSE